MPLKSVKIPQSHILQCVKRHGRDATSFQILADGFDYWQGLQDGIVAYFDTGKALVVAGAPIAAGDDQVVIAADFDRAANEAGRRVVYFGVERGFADKYPGKAISIGEQPVWNPQVWVTERCRVKRVMHQIGRARAKHVSVRPLHHSEVANANDAARQEIARVIQTWQSSLPMKPMGFLVDMQPFHHASERLYFVAYRACTMVGFLVAAPVYKRNGWLFEHFVCDPKAPNGTTELLIDEAMCAVAKSGSTYVTLGLSPLCGSLPLPLKLARFLSSRLYNFRGLHEFKTKLAPGASDPMYIAYPMKQKWPLAIYDTLCAFARGKPAEFIMRPNLIIK